jgi:hypothetical protein
MQQQYHEQTITIDVILQHPWIQSLQNTSHSINTQEIQTNEKKNDEAAKSNPQEQPPQIPTRIDESNSIHPIISDILAGRYINIDLSTETKPPISPTETIIITSSRSIPPNSETLSPAAADQRSGRRNSSLNQKANRRGVSAFFCCYSNAAIN